MKNVRVSSWAVAASLCLCACAEAVRPVPVGQGTCLERWRCRRTSRSRNNT